MFRASAQKRKAQLMQMFTSESQPWLQGAYGKAVKQLDDLAESCIDAHRSSLKMMEWDFQYYGASLFHFDKVTGDVAVITLVKRRAESWP